jgi:hypothetical protein
MIRSLAKATQIDIQKYVKKISIWAIFLKSLASKVNHIITPRL